MRGDNLRHLKFDTRWTVDRIDQDAWTWELRWFRWAVFAWLTVDNEDLTRIGGFCHDEGEVVKKGECKEEEIEMLMSI